MIKDSEGLPFDQVPLTKREFIADWEALSDVPAADFVADRARQLTVYEAFARHQRLALQISRPPVLVFKEAIQNKDPHLAVREDLLEGEDIFLAVRSWLPQERIITRFHLADDDSNIYFLTPPIGVASPPARPRDIRVARVSVDGGFREVYSTNKNEWQEKRKKGLYVDQNTRNAWIAYQKTGPQSS